MKLQRVKALTKKEIKKTILEPSALFMIFLFPIVFVLTFGASFGGLGSSQPVYNVGVVNLEASSSLTQTFLEALSNTELLHVQVYVDNQTAQSDLSQGKIQAVIVIPSTFSQSLTSYHASPNDPSIWVNTTISLHLDKGSVFATQALPPLIQNVLNALIAQNQPRILTPISVEISPLIEVKQLSTFEFMAPGMFTFASIFLIMMVAQSFTQDRENGMLRRIRITPTTPTEFMASQIISYMLVALTQAVLVFAAIHLIGFKPQVSIPAYLAAFTFVLIFSLSNVGFGLITATVSKTSSTATGISFIFLLPQLFLGTFVGASLSSAAQVASRFIPSYYVTDALTSLFLRGATITSPTILLDLIAVSTSCLPILAFGITLHSKYCKL